jgi:hypothetical protein
MFAANFEPANGNVIIEAESKSQARRIFIQRGWEILQIVAIEDLQEGLASNVAGNVQ